MTDASKFHIGQVVAVKSLCDEEWFVKITKIERNGSTGFKFKTTNMGWFHLERARPLTATEQQSAKPESKGHALVSLEHLVDCADLAFCLGCGIDLSSGRELLTDFLACNHEDSCWLDAAIKEARE